MMGGDDRFYSQALLKRANNTLVERHSSLEYDGRQKLLSQSYIVEVVPDQSLAQSIHDVFQGIAQLLFMNHV